LFLKLRPLFFSLLFLLGLEVIILKSFLVFSVSLILFLVSLLEGKKLGKQWKFSILPVSFVFSSIILLYLITLAYEQQIFIILSSGIYYLSLFGAYRLGDYDKDQTAKGMIMAATVTTVFFIYAGLYGIYLNFLVPLVVLMIAYFAATLLISYQYFSIVKNDETAKVWIYSFLLALVMAELIWTMNFWPFGYLTTGVIALILYYVLWDIVESHFLDVLSRKRIMANMMIFSLLIGFVLLSSKWIPVI